MFEQSLPIRTLDTKIGYREIGSPKSLQDSSFS
jgi:hypothetical protein